MFSPQQVTTSCRDHFHVTLIQSNLTDSSAIQYISQATNKKNYMDNYNLLCADIQCLLR